jgi:unsaturated chondroitin disaccharide hydrolase
MGEQDEKISLLRRLIDHASNTARYSVYYGQGRDAYDVAGRTAHESVFNVTSGAFRCPNSQQGYSPFSTWTRGLAWAICGFAEQLEYLATLSEDELVAVGGNKNVRDVFLKAALATADFYLKNSCADGIPMWDTGAPGLCRFPDDYLNVSSDPYNDWEPVDSSAAAIAAQGLWRLGRVLGAERKKAASRRYQGAALAIARTLSEEPYLSTQSKHQGLLLHSVYHRPNGWDHICASWPCFFCGRPKGSLI